MPRTVSVEQQNQLIKLWKQGVSRQGIAKQFKLSMAGVGARIAKLRREGLLETRRTHLSFEQKKEMAKQFLPLWEQGFSLKEISDKYQVSANTVRSIAREFRFPSRRGRLPKRNELKEKAVLILYAEDFSYEDIGQVLHLSRQRVHQIWSRAKAEKES